MLGRRADLEWEFLSDEEQEKPWPRESPSPVEPGRIDVKMRRTIVFGCVLVALLAAGAGGAYARNEALQGVEEVGNGVQAAVEAEQWANANAPELSADMLVDDVASHYVDGMMASERRLLSAVVGHESSNPVLQIDDTWFVDRIAAAEVRLSLPTPTGDDPAVYRQTRFYRETPQGWLRTAPDPALWGPTRSMETEHLIWRYRQRDEAVVLAIARDMDALYAQWLLDHGLAQARDSEKLAIVVQVDYPPEEILSQDHPEQVVVVTSPAAYLVPQELTDREVLAQAVALALLESLWAQSVDRYGSEKTGALLAGVELWQQWQAGRPLSNWGDPVVRWLRGAPMDSVYGAPGERGFYLDLCAAHGIWMIRPLSVGVPVHCEGSRAGPLALPDTDMYTTVDMYTMRSSLANVTGGELEGYVGFRTPWAIQLGNIVTLSTVVDYVVATYGRDSLPTLVAALGQHDKWETLVPAVYGVPLEEFERGWQRHLSRLEDGNI